MVPIHPNKDSGIIITEYKPADPSRRYPGSLRCAVRPSLDIPVGPRRYFQKLRLTPSLPFPLSLSDPLPFLIRIRNPAQKHRHHTPNPQPRQQRQETPPHTILKRIPYHRLHHAR